MDKLTQLSDYIDGHMRSPNIIPTQRFVFARDQAYFKAVFFSGDTPGDMGQLKVPEMLRFPNDDGFLFNHVCGKTLRDGDNNVFGIKRNPQTKICPVQGIEHLYGSGSAIRDRFNEGIPFSPNYSSREHTRCTIQIKCGGSSLKGYLKEMGSDDGETLLVFSAGCAITLALSEAELSEIMDHVGWTRRHSALHYLQFAVALNTAGAFARYYQQWTFVLSRLSGMTSMLLNSSSVPFLYPRPGEGRSQPSESFPWNSTFLVIHSLK